MTNPLLQQSELPLFASIKAEHMETAIRLTLEKSREQVEELLESNQEYTWSSLVQPLEELDDQLKRQWSTICHLNAVANSEIIRPAYNACLTMVSEYSAERGQHGGLFQAFDSIAKSDAYGALEQAQRKVIENTLLDFRLSGINLMEEKKQRFKQIKQRLADLSAKFTENLLDATQAWTKEISDEKQLAGLPESALALARETAKSKKLEGFLLTLEMPCYIAVMTYADSQELRREMYEAFVTRASDQGPNAEQWDNTDIINETLTLRHEMSLLLGLKNYAEQSITKKMTTETDQVIEFLHNLSSKSISRGKLDLQELQEFALEHHGIESLQVWDASYYSEKLKQSRYAVSDEDFRPYFPENKVLEGLFAVVHRLYGLKIQERQNVETWHEAVRFFDLYDDAGELRGQFYLDLYARPQKRGGAWMAECRCRTRLRDGSIQLPVAYLTCNLNKPVGDQPALFTHREVQTLFHEFGHGLHHMLTRIDYADVSGINGVAWDAVELPSQIMENWLWEKETLTLISGHYQTGESLPEQMLDKLLAAKNFQSGLGMLRQLELALFDFRLHLEYQNEGGLTVQELLDEVRGQVSLWETPAFNRFQHGFAHIFAGGYAAGYYSYKWAEVLSADAYSRFEEEGIFNQKTGKDFMTCILEQGGSKHPMELFKQFRGGEPSIDALLRHNGISN